MTYETKELMIEISQNLAKQVRQWHINEQFVFDKYLGMFIRLYMGANGKVFKHESVNLNTYLHTNLKMDAFEILELVMLIEKGFGFYIPENKTNEILMRDININNLCKLIIECKRDPKCYVAPARSKKRAFNFDKNVLDRYMQRKMRCMANEMTDTMR